MKKGLLGSTAIVAATAFTIGAAGAAEAPTMALNGFVDFQLLVPDHDVTAGIGNRSMYLAVEDAELSMKASGVSDSGLKYGLKVEFEGSPGGGNVGDEARISIGGSFGTVFLGDEDGAEDGMTVGGENLMGGSGGFDGDQDDYYDNPAGAGSVSITGAPTGPGDLDGDNSDTTKITYYSNEFSGFKFGVSYAPQRSSGDNGIRDQGAFENYIGAGAQYSTAFGGMGLKVGGVYATAANQGVGNDLSAFAGGAVLTFGAIGVAGGYSDMGDADKTFWDLSASYSAGPASVAIGYFSSELTDGSPTEGERTHLAVTADYSLAPGLGVYAEYNMIDEDLATGASQSGSVIMLGAIASF